MHVQLFRSCITSYFKTPSKSSVPRLTHVFLQMLKPPAARHESAIMRDDFSRHTPFQRADGRHVDFAPASMSLRAAAHDHSYHRVLSHPQGGGAWLLMRVVNCEFVSSGIVQVKSVVSNVWFLQPAFHAKY